MRGGHLDDLVDVDVVLEGRKSEKEVSSGYEQTGRRVEVKEKEVKER